MRTLEEIGGFEDKETDKWYSVYASMYLDYVDDNLRHFTWRNVDLYPIRNCEDRNKWAELYKEAAKTLFIDITENGGIAKEDLLLEYPILTEFIN